MITEINLFDHLVEILTSIRVTSQWNYDVCELQVYLCYSIFYSIFIHHIFCRYFFRQLRNTLYARGVTATKYYTSSIFNVLTTPEAVFFLVYHILIVMSFVL